MSVITDTLQDTLLQSFIVVTLLLVFSTFLLFFVCNYRHWIVRRRWAPVRGDLLVFVMMMMIMTQCTCITLFLTLWKIS